MTDTIPASGSFAAALAAFQRELPRVGKDNTAKVKSDKANYSYQYADLADVSAAVLPALGRQGLSWNTLPTVQDDGKFALHYELLHISGESRSGVWPLPAASSAPQALGSAITYARRYCLCAVTGVSPDNDDDGTAAQLQARSGEQRNHDERDFAEAETGYDEPDWARQITVAETVGDLPALHRLWGKVTGRPEYLDQIKTAAARVRERHMSRLFAILAEAGIPADDAHKPHRHRIATRVLDRSTPVTSYTELTATDVATFVGRLTAYQKSGDLGAWLAVMAQDPEESIAALVDRILSAPNPEVAAAALQEVAEGTHGDVDVAHLLTGEDRDALAVPENEPLLLLDLAEKGMNYCGRHMTGPRVPPPDTPPVVVDGVAA